MYSVKLIGLLAFVQFAQPIFGQCIPKNGYGTWHLQKTSGTPYGAVVGGLEPKGVEQYICKAKGIPGKEVNGKCYIAENKKEQTIKSNFEVLTYCEGVWTPVFNRTLPCNALPVSTDANGVPMYSGRIFQSKILTVGRVQDGALYVTYKGKEQVYFEGFEVFTSDMTKEIVEGENSPKKYEMSGDYLSFRAESGSAVYLNLGSKDATNKFLLTISGITSIEKVDTHFQTSAGTDNVINASTYSGFWLYKTENTLEFGLEGDIKPRLTFVDEEIKDITHFSLASNGYSYWYLPSLKTTK